MKEKSASLKLLYKRILSPIGFIIGFVMFSFITPILFPFSLWRLFKKLIGYKSKLEKESEKETQAYEKAVEKSEEFLKNEGNAMPVLTNTDLTDSALKEIWYEENEPLGRTLGYPDCCIDEFCDQPPELLKKYGTDKNDTLRYDAGCINGKFTGFIPCINHAQQIMDAKIILTSLIKDRLLTYPEFPYYGRNEIPKK